jgi:hypothetical protein
MSDFRMHRQSSCRSIFVSSLSLATLVLPLVAGSALAQGVDIPAILNPDLKAPPTAVTVQYGHQFKTDVEDKGTEMSRDNAMLSVAHRIKLSEKASFFALGTYTLQNYNFSSNSGNAYQWGDVHRAVLGGLFGYDLNDRWRLIGGGIVRSWGEGGADYGDSISGGLIGGFDYHPNEDFSIGLIIGAFSALEDSLALFPVPTMKWNFAEDWKLHVGMVSVFDPGVGLEVSWQVSETVSIGTGAVYQSRRYRLSDSTRAANPSRPSRTDENGVGQETELPVFAMLQWKPTPKSSLDLLAGVAFAGNVRVETSTGGYISDDSYDPAPFVGLKGTIAF